MKCLILAAGYATRLYPLTENYPKPLLEVKNKKILDWLIDDLETTKEISEYIVVTNHKYASVFENWIKERCEKITLIDDGTITNETRLGTLKDISLAVNELKINDDLFVMAGDNVLDFSLRTFIDYFKEKKVTCIMKYYEEDLNTLKKRSTIKVDNNDKVLEMLEKPSNPDSHYCCPPFYIYAKDDLKYIDMCIKNADSLDAPGGFISYLYDKRPIYAMTMPGDRYDIGDINSYQKVNSIYKGVIE